MMGASPAFASSPLAHLTNSPQLNGRTPYTPAPRDTPHSPVPESEFFLKRGVGGTPEERNPTKTKSALARLLPRCFTNLCCIWPSIK